MISTRSVFSAIAASSNIALNRCIAIWHFIHFYAFAGLDRLAWSLGRWGSCQNSAARGLIIMLRAAFLTIFFLFAFSTMAQQPPQKTSANHPINSKETWQTIDHFQVKDGLVKDTRTGLMWMRCILGSTWNNTSCQGKGQGYSWEEAMKIPQGFTYAGYSDWRIPSVEELMTLVDKEAGNEDEGIPFINQSVFSAQHRCMDEKGKFDLNNKVCTIWSSAPNTYDNSYAWCVDFYIEDINADPGRKDRKYGVRLVRGGI